ncbi:adenosylmethionine--8-amino-7-oxononanoate transaminase [Cutibacterium avidum]|uniref:Adenosylmethionine-8-amino-7-oxononanoate aminotransferase n=1 Tax=Cutibacterium avidum TaxID=33010 RepID=A0A3E2DDV4_9ACTN|nr:adenosylmethionine--8-amino-7-oxononanoate transaminase [Cutibacterium avidum]MCO6679755.1 adenosylmethionine--8-amino-7-oxononanoate transaminase [Cutibacterium avidum]MDU3218285.1 adenosylmethionine--8-amino-7-oxononanoate transaminase [Cutibacterium avidum]MDU5514881.1 adenosylmethionine--8-amino-7-oxononanoate transaminase [Cutibacterium avidum]MDU5545967.1 adenosylmethionine--8-amino-7-oxononanoate transaminase [Cutibacterium avidum]MDU8014856.1 adenosylmethionine--8-amino-7-oxononanoa
MSLEQHLLEYDRRHVWHPYAPTVGADPMLAVTAADGVRLQLHDGEHRYEVIDGMASWWCQIHGYRNPVLDEAVSRQSSQFSHVMFGGLTHQAAVDAVKALVDLAPEPLDRVFLADSGSVGVEVSLKLARQVQIARTAARGGTLTRTRIAALRGAYHGDTLGAMSVCDPVGGMHAMFSDSIPRQLFLPRPPSFDADVDAVETWCDQTDDIVDAHRDELAGIIVEPILQGAGGMWPWSPACLKHLRQRADDLDLVLIADEVATGFGRTGKLFACEWADIVPDIMVVGKSMTGGYMTQSAVLCSDELATEVSRGPGGSLMHGPTFMGNPLASAVTAASLGIVAQGGWQDDVARINEVMSRELTPLRDLDGVTDVRVFGAIAAVQVDSPIAMRRATRTAVENQVWLRPFRDLVYAMPPYICTEDDLVGMAAGMRAVVTDQLTHTSLEES